MRQWKWNKSQRMQLKAFTCVLGILLLLILLTGRLIWALLPENEQPLPVEPVVLQLKNVWIMEVEPEGLLVFEDGRKKQYPYHTGPDGIGFQVSSKAREQIADITLTDGAVTQVHIKTEKVNGKILAADSSGVEVEGIGRIPLAADYKGYYLYDNMEMCQVSDVLIGYDFTDLVVENGSICGILLAKEEAMEYIRVLLKSSGYGGILHESVTFSCDTDYVIRYGAYDNPMEEMHSAGEVCTIDLNGEYFQADRIFIEPAVLTGKILMESVSRSQGIPAYRGRMELIRTEDGIAVVNEVLLEEYLYSVVPSEMPSSYPEEALKAQAICARTYAYGHMLRAGYPQYGAHVDDSTSYQVYNNILEQESTTTAVRETYGQLLMTANGELAGTYYYSTSCGVGSDANVWKTDAAKALTYLKARAVNRKVMEQTLAEAEETQSTGENQSLDLDLLGQAMTDEETFEQFITTKSTDDYEVTEGWYRWSYEVEELNRERMLEMLQKRYEANEKHVLTLQKDGEYESLPVTELGMVTDLFIAKRGAGGIAEELVIETENAVYKVVTEHNIRYVLNEGNAKVVRQDGSRIDSPNLLPSGFFMISPDKEKEEVVGYTLIGGGFGHGVGMSQNGAKGMAKDGLGAEEILTFFYDGCILKNVYEASAEG